MQVEKFKSSLKKAKILLIGDVMLDKYVFGKITRISPEAPVPVFLSEGKKEVLGGAANVLNNLSSLGVDATFMSVIGKDEPGKRLKQLLKENNIKKTYFYEDKKRTTSSKTRYLANSQQIIRIDSESEQMIPASAEHFILSKFKKLITNYNVVVISDYKKGVITPTLMKTIIKISKSNKVPVIVDPKNKKFDIYKNVFLVTPNQYEASEVSGISCNTNEEAEYCAKYIMKNYNINNVIITRGEKGLTYLNKNKIVHAPTKKKEVFDVSGAGDTILAILAISIANKIEIENSLYFANKAAGVVVGKIGTSTINMKELLEDENSDNNKKILKINELKKIVKKHKERGLKIGFTNGCFDILHYGHISYLEQTKKLCDKLIVAINSDKSVKKIKGSNRPRNSQALRAKVLASLHFCDYIIIFKEDTPINLIRILEPHLLTKGGDYKKSEVIGSKDLESWGGETKVLNYIRGLSSTKLFEK